MREVTITMLDCSSRWRLAICALYLFALSVVTGTFGSLGALGAGQVATHVQSKTSDENVYLPCPKISRGLTPDSELLTIFQRVGHSEPEHEQAGQLRDRSVRAMMFFNDLASFKRRSWEGRRREGTARERGECGRGRLKGGVEGRGREKEGRKQERAERVGGGRWRLEGGVEGRGEMGPAD
eukprot:3021225-Rhodomonas_salina.1